MATAPQQSATFQEPIDSSRLLSWGANSHGQLGQAHTEDQYVPVDTAFSATIPCQLTGGGGHTFVLSEGGTLYACGSNSSGQLGMGNQEDLHVPTILTLPSPVVVRAVAAGWDFTLALTDSGAVYSWGNNAFNQLGRHTSDKISPHPALVVGGELAGVEMVDIAAGLRHALALSAKGSVYGWGQNKRGQAAGQTAGSGGKQQTKTPVQKELPAGIRPVKIVAGANHSGLLTDSGAVYMWGCNRFGQMAQDPSHTAQHTDPCCIPASVFSDQRVKDIASGWTHNLALTDAGAVYSWGRADYGQLGRSCGQSCDPHPKQVAKLCKVHAVACGSEHNLTITGDGELFSWGWNEHGMCGTGNESNVYLPVQVTVQAGCAVAVGCGAGHSLVLVKR